MSLGTYVRTYVRAWVGGSVGCRHNPRHQGRGRSSPWCFTRCRPGFPTLFCAQVLRSAQVKGRRATLGQDARLPAWRETYSSSASRLTSASRLPWSFGQPLERLPGGLGNSDGQTRGSLPADGDRQPAPVAGEGALSEPFDELIGKAAAVGQVDLVGSQGRRRDRSGRA